MFTYSGHLHTKKRAHTVREKRACVWRGHKKKGERPLAGKPKQQRTGAVLAGLVVVLALAARGEKAKP
jgi:hypothetical protein